MLADYWLSGRQVVGTAGRFQPGRLDLVDCRLGGRRVQSRRRHAVDDRVCRAAHAASGRLEGLRSGSAGGRDGRGIRVVPGAVADGRPHQEAADARDGHVRTCREVAGDFAKPTGCDRGLFGDRGITAMPFSRAGCARGILAKPVSATAEFRASARRDPRNPSSRQSLRTLRRGIFARVGRSIPPRSAARGVARGSLLLAPGGLRYFTSGNGKPAVKNYRRHVSMDPAIKTALALCVLLAGVCAAMLFRNDRPQPTPPEANGEEQLLLRYRGGCAHGTAQGGRSIGAQSVRVTGGAIRHTAGHRRDPVGPSRTSAVAVARLPGNRSPGQFAPGRVERHDAADRRAGRPDGADPHGLSTATRCRHWQSVILAQPPGRRRSTKPIATCLAIRDYCPSARN